nr:nucleotide-binding alpha-beta plait domain-containing protein [Tanacetum cinerariifolium]
MGIFRIKEDEVSKISTSIFVSNFSDSFSSKDLFHACKQYGHVVDSFIPSKRAKDGNRFGFVRFINVCSVERLGSGMSLETESTHTIVLDDECLNTKDLSCSLMGRVKEFTSLSNLKKVLCNEGFDVLKISYLGELWVLIEFESAKVKYLFKENGGANSWFSVLNQASEDFTLGGRIAWVEVEGIPFKLWSGNTFNRIASKWAKLMEVDDYDDMNFHSKRLCILTKVYQNILEGFKIVFHGKVYWMRAKEVPGWTPEFTKDEEEDDVSVEDNHGGIHSDQEINNCNDVSDVEEVNEEVAGDDNSLVHTVGGKENSGSVNKMPDSMGSCRLKKSGMPRTGGSILSFMKEVVKVGQTMRYNMDGCVKDITEIIKSQGEFRVHR